VKVLDSLRLTHGRFRLAGDSLSRDVHGAAGQVVNRPAIRPEREPKVTVAELVEHPGALRRDRGDAVEDLDALGPRVEPEQVT